MFVYGQRIRDVAEFAGFHLRLKLAEKKILLQRMVEQFFCFFDSHTQKFGKCLLSIRVITQLLLNHLRHAGFNDVGFIAGFVAVPLFGLFALAHFTDFIHAIRFTNLNAGDMLIQQFFTCSE